MEPVALCHPASGSLWWEQPITQHSPSISGRRDFSLMEVAFKYHLVTSLFITSGVAVTGTWRALGPGADPVQEEGVGSVDRWRRRKVQGLESGSRTTARS
ncbi:unnamed protein product [Menidia menidia]|uniref:(Atlantic silverside) hypothetical protein n=1 Tax=Menidia menidia TaxID=238744 RepID=A0A8S4BNT5_9TELE|nr:unnamed protein product [Menidia menidia]